MIAHFSSFARHAGLCAVHLALLGSPAYAEKADRAKPMNAEADSLRYDDSKQTSVFTGNVVITKGTMVIRADRVEVRQDKDGFQFGSASSIGGGRAFFRQKRDLGDEWIEGEAEMIAFDGKADTVTFSRQATLRRLRGASISDETQGAVITYDNNNDMFNVMGAAATSGSTTGRVRAVISPRGGTTSAPAASTATQTAPLKPSTSLRQ